MKKVIALLVILTIVLSGYTLRAAEDTIVICSSSEQFRNDYIQEALRAKFPQYNIVVMYMSTGKAAAKVAVEKEKTDIDILVGLETGYLSKIQDSLADISGLSRIDYLPGLTPEDNGNKWVTWERQARRHCRQHPDAEKIRIARSPDLRRPAGPAIPRSDRHARNPKSSGTGYFFYKNWVNIWGEEKALAYVDKLHSQSQAVHGIRFRPSK